MASISHLNGVQSSPLVGQVTERFRPASERRTEAEHPVSGVMPDPSGLKEMPNQPDNDPQKRVSATLEETQEVAAKLQEKINELSTDPYQVSISTDESTQASVIQIKDHHGEVIKQFPPEKVLNLHQKLDDLSGMVIDEMT